MYMMLLMILFGLLAVAVLNVVAGARVCCVVVHCRCFHDVSCVAT
jgi:hypothetical protein